MQFALLDEQATIALGRKLAQALVAELTDKPLIIYLDGDLGAGKTTLSRGLVQALGHQGAVKSPTYTIVEPYRLKDITVYHFDLYRLADAEELEYLGLRDFLASSCVCLFEWPGRGQGVLPAADLQINLQLALPGRCADFKAQTATGERILAALLSAQMN